MVQDVRAALGPSGRASALKIGRAARTMGRERTHRLLFASLSIVLAGFLAIGAKLSPPPDRTRVEAGAGPSTSGAAVAPVHIAPATPVVAPPRAERPIQPPDEPTADPS